MPSPSASGSTTSFKLSGTNDLDAILNEDKLKWGGASGAPVVTYSFPRANASWSAEYGDEVTRNNFAELSPDSYAKVTASLQTWSAVANISFQLVTETANSVGDIRFAYSYAVNDSAWGYAWYPSPDPWAGDIWINRKLVLDQEKASFAAGTIDFENLIHEAGHAIGLKHPGNYNAGGGGSGGPYITPSLDKVNYTIMSYTEADWADASGTPIYPRTPGVYDIRAIQYLYGANTATNADDTTYEFSPSELRGESLWDGGGDDTIDASDFSVAVKIDLVDGNYSSIGLDNNIGIAFDAVIEAAVGGSGADTLIGNDASNTLTGNAGSDKFLFNAAIDGTKNVDTITDFRPGEDKLYLNAAVFSALDSAKLTQSLVSGTGITPSSSAQHLLYDTATGILSYDADGNGSTAAIRFAKLSGAPKLTAGDIQIVGSGGSSSSSGQTASNITRVYDGQIESGGSTKDTLEGGTGDDQIAGEEGNDSLSAGDGDDYLDGGDGNDWLEGDDGDDVVSAGAGDDVVYSGLGNDEVYGDDGKDKLYLDEGDDYSEAGGGADSVFGGTGNDQIFGDAGNDKIEGGEGDDEIGGDDGSDMLLGGAGNDVLEGGSGADKMAGGIGDDIYFVDTKKDVVAEKSGQGDDSVVSSISYVLGNFIENLFLYGDVGLTGIGNKLDNYLCGSDEDDRLNGKEGQDILEGGQGDDVFVFDTKLSTTTNADWIDDFVSGQDSIMLSKKIFVKLPTGVLSDEDLLITSLEEDEVASSESGERFIYDEATGNLYFDRDGMGSAVGVLFVTLTGQPELAASDIFIA
jgi:serralysin